MKYIPGDIGLALASVDDVTACRVYEICLRSGRPVTLRCLSGEYYICAGGRTSQILPSNPLCITTAGLAECFTAMCGYSVHSHSREISEGFLTLDGGHRAGFCGTAVVRNGQLETVREISSVSIRIAHENRRAAQEVSAELFDGGICSAIICGAPSSGKTTVLRDLTRRLSDGLCGINCKVSLADERNELAAVKNGLPQFDVGNNTDILTLYPKCAAIDIALRSLSPDVIVCDEVGSLEETEAVTRGFNSGIRFIVSVHAHGRRDFLLRPHCVRLLASGAFEKVVFLERRGEKISFQYADVEELRNEIDGMRHDILGIYPGRVSYGQQTVATAGDAVRVSHGSARDYDVAQL